MVSRWVGRAYHTIPRKKLEPWLSRYRGGEGKRASSAWCGKRRGREAHLDGVNVEERLVVPQRPEAARTRLPLHVLHLLQRLRLEHAAADGAAHPARGRARARRRRACAAARAEVLEGERLRIQLRLLRKGTRYLSDASAEPQPCVWLSFQEGRDQARVRRSAAAAEARAGSASLGRVDLEQVRCHRASGLEVSNGQRPGEYRP